MSWRIDVLNNNGNVLGSGPITSAASWQSTARMDRAGTFSFEMPAGDSKASLIEPLRIVRCFATLGGAWTEIGAGVVERIETEIGADGEVTLAVSGSDLIAQLAQRIMGTEYLDGSATITPPMTPVSHATVVAYLENVAYTTGWRMMPDPTPPIDSLVGRWNYESVLQALVSLAKKCQTHFYVSGYQRLTFASTAAASGVRAVAASESVPGSGMAAITQLRKIEDAADVVTTVIPFGAGNADARLSAKSSTRVAGPGYSSPTSVISYRLIRAVTSEALYGQRMRVVVFNDITPISSTDADVRAAADALWDAAFYYLQQHETPSEFYNLTVAQCPTLLRPMQTIRVVHRDPAQNVDIDADLLILEAQTTLDVDGPRTTNLVVATVDRYPESDTGTMVGRLSQSQMYQAAPQLNANSYVISYNKPIDDVETAVFRFRFDSEVVQLTRLTFDFQLLPLESTVKSVAGTSQTTAAGGATTSSSGGATTTAAGGATTSSSGGATTSSGGSSHSHTVSNHTHDVPNHQHSFLITGGSSPTYPIGFGAAGTAGGLVHNASGSNFNYPTNSGEGGATSSNGGGQTSSSEGSHTHTIGDHAHTIGSHTHTIGDHAHTIGSHTHDFTPTITASYGIFRDSGANTFGLTDVEYSVDGSTWYAFTVGVNGFASLGDGWYRVDLTSLLQNSTTLRPTNNNNALRVRRKAAGAIKRAMIEAQLNVRTIIQAIAAI